MVVYSLEYNLLVALATIFFPPTPLLIVKFINALALAGLPEKVI
jgi:hypothetical protein